MNFLAIRGGARTKTKPFPVWPQWNEDDEKALLDALHGGRWARGAQDNNLGKNQYCGYIERLEQLFASMHQARYGLAVTSGTAALDLAIRGIGILPGDEVIVTPYSFIASATCILNSGAIPVMTDVCYDTWNLDTSILEKYITPKTKAIVVVHFGGQPANMDELVLIAKKYDLKIIEDAAHAIGAKWQGIPVGAIGDVGCFSLQSSKNVTSGEGGVLITNNKSIYEKMFSLHISGRAQGGGWYQHDELGWNYRITEFQAALACSQFSREKEQDRIRTSNAQYLEQLLEGVEGIEVVKTDPRVTDRVYHIFAVRYLASQWKGLSRKRFMLALNAEGIPCHEGYLHPIYKNPLFLNSTLRDYAKENCPVAEAICKEAIWFHQELLLGDRQDIEEIAEAIMKIKSNINELKG